MKKISAFLVGAGLIASSVLAADPVTSVNVVGYERFSVPTGTLALVRCDFMDLGVTMNVGNVIGKTLPVGSQLYFWNGAGYRLEQYLSYLVSPPSTYATNWFPNTNILTSGSAFWIRLPSTGTQASYDIVISGEVPGNSRMPSNTVAILPGLNLVGYSYPVEVSWTNTSLSKQAVVGDKLYLWTGSGYSIYNYQSFLIAPPSTYATNWGGAQSLIIKPGEGFWYSRGSSADPINWTEIVPYVLP